MRSTLFLVAAVLAAPAVVHGAPPIVYDGHIAQDALALQGEHALHFTLYDAAQGGSVLCEHHEDAWPFVDGWFSVPLAGCMPSDLSGAPEAYLEVALDDAGSIGGRQRVGAVPWAWFATDLVNERHEPRTIASDVTLQVSECQAPRDAPYCSISDALAWLRDKEILPGALVTIRVGNGVYFHDAPIELAHRDGDKIAIVGNDERPDAVQLVFRGSSGLVGSYGRVLRLFTGFLLRAEGEPPAGEAVYGVRLDDGASVRFGNLVVQGFTWGLFASTGARLIRSSEDEHRRTLEVVDCNTTVSAESGGHIAAPGVVVRGGERGLYSNYGSYLFADDARVEDIAGTCFHAYGGAILRAHGGQAMRCGGNGFRAEMAGFLEARPSPTDGRPARSQDAGGTGYYSAEHATMDASYSRAEGAGERGYQAYLRGYLFADDSQASGSLQSGYIALNDGLLRVSAAVAVDNDGGPFSPAPVAAVGGVMVGTPQ